MSHKRLTSPTHRAVLADAMREAGTWSLGRMRALCGVRFVLTADASAYDADADADASAYDADADADAHFNAYADVNADAYTDAYADANAGANAFADAYANAFADAYAYADANAHAAFADAYAYADTRQLLTTHMKEDEMRDGLHAVTLAAGSLTVLRVGWFRRLEGDDYEVVWRTPYRPNYTVRLSDVWAKGPNAASGWEWGPALASDVTRLQFVPLARLDPAQWEKLCPRPEGW